MTMKLSIGWAEEDVTPRETVDLFGQYYHRVSQGVHSPLVVTALALEGEDGEQATLVSLEIACYQEGFLKELRERLRVECPGTDPDKVFLNTTHTHNAPGVDPITGIRWLAELPECLPAAEYRRRLLDGAVKAIGEARRNRKPGGVAPALASARVGHCRRAVYSNGTAEMYGRTDRGDFIGMEGGEDSGVDLLYTFDGAGVPTGVILNLACPAQVMEATYQVSSDFIGEARRRLKESFGGHFRTLGQISAAGCQAPRDLVRQGAGEPDFWHADGVALIGKRLAEAVERACPEAATRMDGAPCLRHTVKRVVLPRRRAGYQDYIAARDRLAQLEAAMPEEAAYRDFCEDVARNEKVRGRPGPYDSKLHPFVLIQNNRAVVARYENQDAAPGYEFEMHVLRLGGVAFATNPFELYLDFGHRIKARSAADRTFVVQLCGGSGGYLPTARAEALGGYGGLIINGEVGSDGGAKLVEETIAAINALWS